METPQAVPQNNVVNVGGKGTDAHHYGRVWNKTAKRWDDMPRVDARECVGSGSHSWTDDDGNSPPQG